MSVRLTIDLGRDQMHPVDLDTDGETLIPHFIWAESVPIYDWTIAKLEAWAAEANAENFANAELQFVRCYAPGEARLKGV